ncbi:unnamed protein product, partial [Ectocarpus sp. 8 AP-2014]
MKGGNIPYRPIRGLRTGTSTSYYSVVSNPRSKSTGGFLSHYALGKLLFAAEERQEQRRIERLNE